MDADRAAQELKVIRELMQRPIRYSTQSGLSAIWAGFVTAVGLAADWHYSGRYGPEKAAAAMWINLWVWAGVFLAALAGVIVFTRLRERAASMPAWSPVKARILRTILPPFLAGVGLTAAIMYRWYTGDGPNEWGLIPAIWMGFYGVALWQLGEFIALEVRLLGAAFIAGAVVSATFFQIYPYWTLGLGFCGLHVIYGAVVWIRHGG